MDTNHLSNDLPSNQLKFDTLRAANRSRIPEFRNARGELAHANIDGSDWSVADWYLAASGEMGEFANLAKKVRRGDLTLDDALPELANELADVIIYLDILAMQLGIDLGDAVVNKFNVVSDRVGASTKIVTSRLHCSLSSSSED